MLPRTVCSILLFTVFAVSAVLFGLAEETDSVVVDTAYGQVRGVRTDKARQFLGIPYASPPTGELRWVKPVPPQPWGQNVLNATQRKPGCPQKYCTKFLPSFSCPTQQSEDCLYLNIWTPLDANTTSLYPVMFFIHGGAFRWGSASNMIYDGNNLTHNGKVIIVDIEYRLGLFGFLYTGDTPGDAQGNNGIQDQRLALQWVQQNIQHFGGDPYKVTIFGQSAGAQSVFVQLMSAKADGLFRAAIVESAPFGIPYRDKTEALLLTKKVSEILRCKNADILCLRSKTTNEINDAEETAMFRITSGKLDEYFEPFGPLIDGDEILMQPMEAAKLGKFQKVPVMLGTVSEEGIFFVYAVWNRTLSKTEYESALAALHPTNFRTLEAEYPPANTSDLRYELSQVMADYLFTCPTRNVTQNLIERGNNQTYLYVFDHATVAKGSWGNATYCEGHVCHAAELGYVFQNRIVGNITRDEAILSELMEIYWTNFAYTMDPNKGLGSPSLPWPQYNPNGSTILHFKTPQSHVTSQFRHDQCKFWDNFGYNP